MDKKQRFNFKTLSGCVAWAMNNWDIRTAAAHAGGNILNGEPAEGELRRRGCWTPEWVLSEGELIGAKKSRESRRIRCLVQYIIDNAATKFLEMNHETGVGSGSEEGKE